MRCDAVKELLEEYVEGELDKARRKKIAEHIAGCESCKKELTITQSIPRLIGSLSTPPVPQSIIPNTLKSLHKPSGLRWWKWQFAAVAVALLVAVLGIGYQRINRKPEISEVEVASAMEDLKFALGIVGAATHRAQTTVLAEGIELLDATKNGSDSAAQAISNTKNRVSEKLWRSLADLVQLNI